LIGELASVMSVVEALLSSEGKDLIAFTRRFNDMIS